MAFERETLDFGSGSFVGGALNNPNFQQLSVQDQAKIIGWAVGCPVVDELTDPNNPNVGRGPEVMLHRYSEVGFWFGHINREAERLNPELYSQLTSSVERLPGEPVGKHEPQSVPDNYSSQIPPTETLVGYAMPRLFIKQLGGKELPAKEKQDRFIDGLNIVKESVLAAKTPEELLAITADSISRANTHPVHPKEILKIILSTGWHQENNADQMVRQFKKALEDKSPRLWKVYSGLSKREKAVYKIL